MAKTHLKAYWRPQLVARAALIISIPSVLLACADDGATADTTPLTGEVPNAPGTQAAPAVSPPGSSAGAPGNSAGAPGATGGSPPAGNGTNTGTAPAPNPPVATPTAPGPSGSTANPNPTAPDVSGDTGGSGTTSEQTTGEGSPGDTSTADTGSDTTGAETDTSGTQMGNGDPVFHIFLMMGQSNMVGVATLQESDRNTDERLQVLGGCNKPPMQWNLADPPLHDCYMNPVGPGDWFGKVMLEKLPEGHTIGLVPTAVSGESINTFISGGKHHQDILDKIEFAKNTPNARFEGIIFHQGETDTNQDWWVGRVVQLYDEVKAAMGIDYDIPFIAGELPADPGNCCASHNPRVHELADALPMGYVVSQEGTKRFDQYHFDHDSVVLMGKRYGETMLEALGW